MQKTNGQWYTDKNGNHYFVENGQSPKEGWEASKRRKMISKGKYNVSEDGENYKEVSKDDYDKYEADETEFDETVDDDFGFDEEDNSLEYDDLKLRAKTAETDGDKERIYTQAQMSYEDGKISLGELDNIALLLDGQQIDDEDNSLESYLSNEGISESFANGIREAAKKGKENLENYLVNEGISSSYTESLYNLAGGSDEGNKERFTLGGDKRLTDEKDIAKMNELSEALKKAGLDNKLEEGWEDVGANMKWHNLTSNGTWVLDPSQWMDYMNDKKSADEIVSELKTNGYFKDKFKPQNAATGGDNDPYEKWKSERNNNLDISGLSPTHQQWIKEKLDKATSSNEKKDIEKFVEFLKELEVAENTKGKK